MDDILLTAPQKRWLALTTAAALVVGVLFLAPYAELILVSAIVAFLFNPVYHRLTNKSGRPGLSAMLTLIISLLVIVIPCCLVIFLTVGQIQKLLPHLEELAGSSAIDNINAAVPKIIEGFNRVLSSLGIPFQLTTEQLANGVRQLLESIGKNTLSFLTSSISGFFDFFTLMILYMFVFTNLLRNQRALLSMFSKLNILGDSLGQLYALRIGAMTKATVQGQFVIALAQGAASSIGLYAAGVHGLFFFSLLIFTVLSIIPLGVGIVTMPIGAAMILFGNIWGGVFLIAWHLLVVTNIDNVLRPRLVPKEARLNSALMLLAVFAGLIHFGFLGIVLGPVLMIMIVTTVEVFISAYRASTGPTEKTAKDSNAGHTSGLRKLWRRGKRLFSSQSA
jgi:predicted PurR-regulated permease PerM